MTAVCAIGLMSGTSMDGIDIAMVLTDGERRIEKGPAMTAPYDPDFRRRLEQGLEDAKRIERREERPGTLAELEREITLRHAAAVRRFLAGAAGRWGKPELVGFHGQTVLHRPDRALTVQLGDGALLARELDLPVIYDMRAKDMTYGGQGAPLVPVYHAALAHALTARPDRFPVAFVNIGGISNVTWVPEQGDPVAFDSGPGNALIDQWVSLHGGVPFDADGAIASEGVVVRSVVDCYLARPFFQRPAPKSLDRNDFSLAEAERLELADGARTLAAVSAEAILKAADHMPAPPRLWILCGGGRRNPHIVSDLRTGAARLNSNVLLAEDAGLNGDSMEAEAWAYLAVRAFKALPLTFPTTTGCREAVSGGVLARPGEANAPPTS